LSPYEPRSSPRERSANEHAGHSDRQTVWVANSCSSGDRGLKQFLIVVLAAWLARQQEAFIEYLKAENRMLKARLGRRRLIFTDTERRLLARHAKAVGRKKLFELDPIVSPDTCFAGTGN
jgi:hypothetical protein